LKVSDIIFPHIKPKKNSRTILDMNHSNSFEFVQQIQNCPPKGAFGFMAGQAVIRIVVVPYKINSWAIFPVEKFVQIL
jgi:hypothetical protein